MRLIVFDATRKPSLLDESWGAGAFSMWFREHSNGMLGALSWEEMFDWLKNRAKYNTQDGYIYEVQFWSHGSPGEVYIDREKLTDYLRMLEEQQDFKSFMNPEGLWWFRACSTFNGEAGQKFAKRFSTLMNCTVAGHTHKIGCPTHSGLHTIKPFQTPKWDVNEGKTKNGKLKRSYFFRPRTIPFWRDTIPEGW